MNDGWWSWVKVKYIARKIREGGFTRRGDLTRIREVIEKVNLDKRRCLWNACMAAMGPEATAELFRGITLPPPEEPEEPEEVEA